MVIKLFVLLKKLIELLFFLADVCRIRLDYDQFVLNGPLTRSAANTAMDGQCTTDRLTVSRVTNPKYGWLAFHY